MGSFKAFSSASVNWNKVSHNNTQTARKKHKTTHSAQLITMRCSPLCLPFAAAPSGQWRGHLLLAVHPWLIFLHSATCTETSAFKRKRKPSPSIKQRFDTNYQRLTKTFDLPVRSATHSVISSSVRTSDDHGYFRHFCTRHGCDHFGSIFCDTSSFCVSSHHETCCEKPDVWLLFQTEQRETSDIRLLSFVFTLKCI